ncbi:expressed unknown protein [Seminavis robusta]|uniref:Uncharacterized protein n=1 Tax=Seminavis robusta TaxID=568900 RepID=A0A9N8EP18_9STRA|nr:expressed unknown protein [Seminavis robusta]|eukprot:Sro1563_g282730.1 n/a (232) ;mRNA; r:26096-26791
MFNPAFTSRIFCWQDDDNDDDEEAEIAKLLEEIATGVTNRLTLDYSTALWKPENQKRLADAFADRRCSLLYISLRSCRCGDDFIDMCLNQERRPHVWEEQETEIVYHTVRLGSILHEGTAGRISPKGVKLLLSHGNTSLRVLDLEGCLDLDWYENCGDEVVSAIDAHIATCLEQGKAPLPQLQELNLKSTGLTPSGAKRIADMQERGQLPQLQTILLDEDLTKPPRRIGPK